MAFTKPPVEGSPEEEKTESPAFEKKEDAKVPFKIGKSDLKSAAKAVKKMSSKDKMDLMNKAKK